VWTGTQWILRSRYSSTEFGVYTPATDMWESVTNPPSLAARNNGGGAWTGTRAIMWGGYGASSAELGTGSRYDPVADSWAAITLSGAPSARQYYSYTWTGTGFIVWGGVKWEVTLPNTYYGDGAIYYP
jgi:hypothetical protein